MSFIGFAADSPQVGDPISMEFTGILQETTQADDKVAVMDFNNRWIVAKFVERFGEGDAAHVAVVNEKGHGILVPVAHVKSLIVLKKID